MTETSFPYAGGQGMTDANYELLMSKVTGDGRIGLDVAGNSLTAVIIYADGTGRRFKVRANTSYLVRGFRWESGDEGIVKSLDANTSGNPRLDLVVLRLDRSDFTVRVVVLKGTPAAVPTLPAVTQQATTTGRYEIPLASIRVAHNTGVNLPNITSADISSYESWLGSPPLIGHSSARPAVKPGGIWTEYDTARSFIGLQTKWHLYAEDSPPFKFNANSSWDPERFSAYVQRRNGTTHFQAIIYRKAGLPVAGDGLDIPILTLSEAQRPVLNTYGTGAQGGRKVCLFYVESSTGKVTLIDHEELAAGGYVHLGPVSWPSK